MIPEKDAGLPLQLSLVFQDQMLLEKKAAHERQKNDFIFVQQYPPMY